MKKVQFMEVALIVSKAKSTFFSNRYEVVIVQTLVQTHYLLIIAPFFYFYPTVNSNMLSDDFISMHTSH